MNNEKLQRLIHAYQLLNTSDKAELGLDGGTGTPLVGLSREFAENFCWARHTVPQLQAIEQSTMDGSMKQQLLHLSRFITQSNKFYARETSENTLSEKECKALLPELKYHAPYRFTFLQWETDEQILHITCSGSHEDDDGFTGKPHHEPPDGTENKCSLAFSMNIYNKSDFIKHLQDDNIENLPTSMERITHGNKFALDMNVYYIVFHSDGTYSWHVDMPECLKIQEAELPEIEIAETWVSTIVSVWTKFMIFLQYPQICSVGKVGGRGNTWIEPIHIRHKASVLRNKPKFEHKKLVISMFGSETGSTNGGIGGRSSGTAFHSVRKHLRRLPDGKFTWVKAHFRGSKSQGVVTKDYILEQ